MFSAALSGRFEPYLTRMRSEPITSPNDPPIHGSPAYVSHHLDFTLRSMDFAVNYNRWILERMKPFLGKRVVEVGAGAGSLSALLLEHGVETLTALEPSALGYPRLRQKLAGMQGARVDALQSTL